MKRVTMAAVLALLPATSLAGHGLLNSFSDLTWLPPPGRTPDQWNYALDDLRERSRLLLADNDVARLGVCLNAMREKLAEAEAMIAKAKPAAAGVAIKGYRDYLARAEALVDEATRERLARALLEHQYMLSVDYPDLPVAPRALLATLIDDIGARYQLLRSKLPRGSAEALFFKEEEVRWSWEM
ncbi:unnamed protein product, partial [Phaeothamnion confervicola]